MSTETHTHDSEEDEPTPEEIVDEHADVLDEWEAEGGKLAAIARAVKRVGGADDGE